MYLVQSRSSLLRCTLPAGNEGQCKVCACACACAYVRARTLRTFRTGRVFETLCVKFSAPRLHTPGRLKHVSTCTKNTGMQLPVYCVDYSVYHAVHRSRYIVQGTMYIPCTLVRCTQHIPVALVRCTMYYMYIVPCVSTMYSYIVQVHTKARRVKLSFVYTLYIAMYWCTSID